MSTASPDSTAVGGGGGTSTVSVETVTGWHVLKVERYSQLKGVGIGNGEHIKSGTFSVGGHRWHIRIFLNCVDQPGNADWVFAGLYLGSSSNVVKAWPTFSVLNPDGMPARRLTSSTGMQARTFPSSSQWSCSTYDCIKRAELESSYIKDDSLQIRCDVTVFKEIGVETATVESLTVPPPDLHHHLGDLLASDIGGDVTFEVGGETFPAHKYMLAARSSVFKAELFGPLKEKGTDQIRIDDMEPRVFKAMLHFIYTDMMLPEIGAGEDRIIMHKYLLVAADRYNMERLKLICEDVLGKCIDTDIAATTLVLAEQHGCAGLKEACFRFFRRPGNLTTVMASDGFQHLKNSCPSLLEELLAKVAP
ncbi:unnamed protein product [Urochloa decumbens]|uniref:Uncharacterized protein n=1 Tax=Urochloa decumbens TaxID=240449 RepID=A0ABC9H092_9POAL